MQTLILALWLLVWFGVGAIPAGLNQLLYAKQPPPYGRLAEYVTAGAAAIALGLFDYFWLLEFYEIEGFFRIVCLVIEPLAFAYVVIFVIRLAKLVPAASAPAAKIAQADSSPTPDH
jgi:hypothetical protein